MEKQGATTTVTKRDVIARQVSAVVFVALPSAALDSPALSAAASGFGFLGGLPRLRLTGGSSPSGLGCNKRKDASEARIGQKESDDVPWGGLPLFLFSPVEGPAAADAAAAAFFLFLLPLGRPRPRLTGGAGSAGGAGSG